MPEVDLNMFVRKGALQKVDPIGQRMCESHMTFFPAVRLTFLAG